MKLKKVHANNHKKCFEVQTAGRTFEFPYSKLSVPPRDGDPIATCFVDRDLGSEAFTYTLTSGKESTIHSDQLLEYHQDPDYTRQMLLYKLTLKAQKLLDARGVKKREIIRRLHTSPAQFYRLLDQTNYKKSIDQMVRMLAALDCGVDVVFQSAAL
ncbi:MAG: helix-turn-helix domain-containing protein [Deltaproteobacteria bacterium]|nr:helix-turn-helix domain-containing protein [Deltaproteobacteria bacterium]